MPTVNKASDDFNRANESPLSGGGNWKSGGGAAATLDLVGNAAVPPTDNDREAIWEGRVWEQDHSSKAVLTVTGTNGSGAGAGLWVRGFDSGPGRDGYRLTGDHAASNNWKLNRVVDGVFTGILTFTRAWTNGDTWELTAEGLAASTTLKIYHNSVLIQTVAGDSSAMGQIGGPGIGHSSSATTSIDNWEGGAVVAGVVLTEADNSPIGVGGRGAGW